MTSLRSQYSNDWGVIARLVSETNHRVMARLEEIGVVGQWFVVLHILLESPGHRMPMSRLAAGAAMSSGGFTKLADRMGREGLLDRRGATGDRRIVHAELTDAGLRLARKAERLYREAVQEIVLGALSGELLHELAGQLAPLEGVVPEVEVSEVVADDTPITVERRRSPRPVRS